MGRNLPIGRAGWLGPLTWLAGASLLLSACSIVRAQPAEQSPKPSRYWLGVVSQVPLPEPLRLHLRLAEKQGLLVVQVAPDGPAAAAKLRRFDVLLKAGDKNLTAIEDLMEALDAGQGKKISMEILREGRPLTVEVTPARRPPNVGRKMLDLPLESLPGSPWQEPWQDLRGLLERVQPGEAARALRFRLMHPGVLLPPGAAEPNPLPEDLTIAITKQGSQPAKVVVSRGDKKWEASEDNLDKLPGDVRPLVERMLGRYTVGSGQPGTLDMVPDLGPGNAPGGPRPAPNLQKQLDQMHRQLDDLRKTLDELKAAQPLEKTPPPIEPPQNKPQ